MKKVQELTAEVGDLINRGLDRHVRLAVTGLSRAGKTAFITSLVNQLLHVSTHTTLPLLQAQREQRLLGAKRVPQTNLCVPRFAYDNAMQSLMADTPHWPEATKDVSEIRLALRFKPKKGLLKYVQDTATLYLDILDYPGEWLLDLPLLNLDYLTWSRQQAELLKVRKDYAQPWTRLMNAFDPLAEVDENALERISDAYTQYLLDCKEKGGFHWVQPGRFVLPGELAGAPVLHFFPLIDNAQYSDEELKHAPKGSMYAMLRHRYQEYCQQVVKRFYKEHFASFDRQIILVDCLSPLNSGSTAFNDMRQALSELMKSFHYGSNSLFKRLFSPNIDRLLFAATKADHITPDQHENLQSLLKQMVQEAWQSASFEGIEMQCTTMASICATEPGFVERGGQTFAALRGMCEAGNPLTLYPGDVPRVLPSASFWQDQGFAFRVFRPLNYVADEPLPHIRIDKGLEFLIGDKLQ